MSKVTWEIERESERERERERERKNAQEKPRIKNRATVTIFFYPFLDHVTETKIWDIQTDQSGH